MHVTEAPHSSLTELNYVFLLSKKALRCLRDPGSFLPHCPQHVAFALRGIGWLRAVKGQEWHLSPLHLTRYHLI